MFPSDIILQLCIHLLDKVVELEFASKGVCAYDFDTYW